MHLLAALAAVAVAADPAGGAPARSPVTIDLAGAPLSIAALARPDGSAEVLVASGRDLDRFRMEGRELVRTGRFRAPLKGTRPLRVDASPAAGEGAARVVVVLGEDVGSTDRGSRTLVHGFLLSASPDGSLSVVGGDRRAWLRLLDGIVHAQAQGDYAAWQGPVRALSGEDLAAGPPVDWARRGLLEATPLPGGADALAFDDGRPIVVERASGERVPDAGLAPDLGAVGAPTVTVQLQTPVGGMGADRFGREFDKRVPVSRRVVAAGGSLYTLLRGREKGLFRKPSGQDAVVRLDFRDGALEVARPFPGVEGFLLDFAVLPRSEGSPLALLLVNEKEDGSGRAYLVVQDPQ